MGNNYWQEDEEEFRDGAEETNLDTNGMPTEMPPVNIRVQTVQQPTPQPEPKRNRKPMQQSQPEPEQQQIEDNDEEDYSSILSDARLRLEQGRLYEMIMNHNIFEGTDADEKAVKHVQRQIRNFAREQMEIMLGMRQEIAKVEQISMENFPFNDLEIQALKALASAATQGATKAPEAQVFTGVTVEKKTGIKPIGLNSNLNTPKSTPSIKRGKQPLSTAKTPVKRTNPNVEKILAEEQVTKQELDTVFDPNYRPLEKPIHQMTPQELQQRDKEISKRTMRKAKSASALPMPDNDQINMMNTTRAQTAASNPQMQNLMNLLLSQTPKK
jgi:hypothetical protein